MATYTENLQQQVDEQLVEMANLREQGEWKDREIESLSFQIGMYVKYVQYILRNEEKPKGPIDFIMKGGANGS